MKYTDRMRIEDRLEEVSNILSNVDDDKLRAEQDRLSAELRVYQEQDFAIQQEARNLGFRD